MAVYTADRRLYLDKNGKVVEADDPNRVTLLVAAGMTLPEARARELGLIRDEPKAAPAPAENKARKAAPENKAK